MPVLRYRRGGAALPVGGEAGVIRLATQFDPPGRPSLAPATPTCCSCCCCCCAVTLATAATLAAVHVHETALAAGQPKPRRVWLTVLAAVSAPVLAPAVARVAVQLGGDTAGLVVGGALVWAALWFGVLVAAHAVAGHRRPRAPSAIFAAGAGVLVVAEVFSLGFFIYGQILAIPVPIAAGILLKRRLRDRRAVAGAG